MTTLLLVIYLWKGDLVLKPLKAESMEQCVAALPEVAKKFPDTAVLSCVNLRDESSI